MNRPKYILCEKRKSSKQSMHYLNHSYIFPLGHDTSNDAENHFHLDQMFYRKATPEVFENGMEVYVSKTDSPVAIVSLMNFCFSSGIEIHIIHLTDAERRHFSPATYFELKK